VFVKEKTTNLLLWKTVYVVNITNVNIETYSDTNDEPGWANITIMNEGVTMMTSQTFFNILNDTSLKMDDVINSGELSQTEIAVIQQRDIGFMVDRSSFTLKRFRLFANFESSNIEVEAIRSIQ
jgi:hypothetical protein